jgi:hypothetical protein
MEERFIEIRFYYFILKLLNKFKYSISTLDIIEAYCNVGNIDSTVIKKLMKQVRENAGIINTYKEEAVYIGRVNKISYRQLAHITGVSLSTQVRLNKYYDEHPEMYVGITKHLPDFEYEQVEKFMKIVDIMKEI